MGQCVSCKRVDPTKEELMARFDRIHNKLQIVFETTNRARDAIQRETPPLETMRQVKIKLVEIERVLDQL